MRSPSKGSPAAARRKTTVPVESYVPGDTVPWSDKETEILKRCLLGHRGSVEDVDWDTICSVAFHGRATVSRRDPASCQARALQLGLLGKGMRVEKIPWKEEEKEALAWAVEGFDGPQSAIPWALIADTLFHGRGGITRRDAKGCREQWNRSINPDLDHKPLCEGEQQFVYDLAMQIGNKWTRISQLLGERFGKAPPGAERVKKGFEKYKRKREKTDQDGQAVAAIDAIAGANLATASNVAPAVGSHLESVGLGSPRAVYNAGMALAPPMVSSAGASTAPGSSEHEPLSPRMAYPQMQQPQACSSSLVAAHPQQMQQQPFGMVGASSFPTQLQLAPPIPAMSPHPLHHPQHTHQSPDVVVTGTEVS